MTDETKAKVELVEFILNEQKIRDIQRNEKLNTKSYKAYEELGRRSKLGESISKLMKDAVVIKDAVQLVGSVAEGKPDSNDIDILMRLSEPTPYLKRAMETRIRKELPPVLEEKLHFIWGDPEGAHDTYIPLYDIVLKKSKSSIPVEMSAELSSPIIEPITPFKPMKSTANEGSTLFYVLDECVEKLKVKNGRWLVEHKYDGFHGIIQKKGDQVKIFSEELKELTPSFPTICSETKQLSPQDLIIEGELVPYYKGRGLGRSPLMKYIGALRSGKKLSDSNIIFHTWDIIYLGKSLTTLPLYERKKILRQLSFTKTPHIRYVPATAADSSNIKQAIEQRSNEQDSEGAMVKAYDSLYSNGNVPYIIKYRKVERIEAVVIKKNETKGSAWTFTVGIYLSDTEKGVVPESYLTEINGKPVLVLGNTFNTASVSAEIGDIIEVNLQEVWRHRLDDKIRYSIHKPDSTRKLNKKESSTISYLDSLVVSKGKELANQIITSNEIKAPQEGREVERGDVQEITDFPERMQRNFKEAMESGMWLPYVIHLHSRGKSTHQDVRHLIPAGYLEGITVNTPPSTERDDEFNEEAEGIRCELKASQPKDWLTYEGIKEPGGVGATAHMPAAFYIISKGKYRCHTVDDHRIIIEYKSDQGSVNSKTEADAKKLNIPIPVSLPKKLKSLTGLWLYQIAHIEDKHIILLKHLKGGNDLDSTAKHT